MNMKLIHTTLIVFTGLFFPNALYAQDISNATANAAAEATVNGEAAATSLSPVGTLFEKSPYPIILEKKPFGTPPDLAALNAVATGMDEAKMKVEQQKLAETFSWTAINITPDGRTAIGFTDLSAKPPANYYMTVGESANNWKVVEADYTSETATIEKDGVSISLKFGNKSPIAPTTPGATPASPVPLETPAITTMAGHNPGLQPGITQPIVEAHAISLPAGGATPPPMTRPASARHSSLLTSYRDRLNERLKVQENQKLETDRKQKEELSKIVTDALSKQDALRKQQEDTDAAAQQQPQGETPALQVQPIEMPPGQ
jgi:hypothetical protein